MSEVEETADPKLNFETIEGFLYELKNLREARRPADPGDITFYIEFYRRPRTKKRRIVNKWRMRGRNWRVKRNNPFHK